MNIVVTLKNGDRVRCDFIQFNGQQVMIYGTVGTVLLKTLNDLYIIELDKETKKT